IRQAARPDGRRAQAPAPAPGESSRAARGRPSARAGRRRAVLRVRVPFRRRGSGRWLRSRRRQPAVGARRAAAGPRARDARPPLRLLAPVRRAGIQPPSRPRRGVRRAGARARGARRVWRVPQRALQAAGPWVLHADATRVARRVCATLPTVGERWTPQLGVKTGADDVFLVREPVPGTRPALRGRDLSAWRAEPRAFLLWTHGPDGRPLARLPPVLEHALRPHLERLRRRADYRSGAPWQVFRTALAVARHRVVWPDLARRLAAVVPDVEPVPLNTAYGVATRTGDEACALAAWLNSR